MKHRLFTLFAIASLLVGLLIAVLWVRSYWIDEFLGWETRDFTTSTLSRHVYALHFSAGGIGIRYTDEYFPDLTPSECATWRGIFSVRTATFRYHELVQYPHAGTFVLVHPNYFGFAYYYDRVDTLRSTIAGRLLGWRTLIVPAWFPVLLSMPLPLYWMVLYRGRWRRESRAKAGCCQICGYDLRGHQPGDKCPECGAAISAQP